MTDICSGVSVSNAYAFISGCIAVIAPGAASYRNRSTCIGANVITKMRQFDCIIYGVLMRNCAVLEWSPIRLTIFLGRSSYVYMHDQRCEKYDSCRKNKETLNKRATPHPFSERFFFVRLFVCFLY
jgi:hypothetical protein